MIPRSLPPLPSQFSYNPPQREVETRYIDSSGETVDISGKRSVPKRKHKGHGNSRNSHLRHANVTEHKNSRKSENSENHDDSQHGYNVQNSNSSLPLSENSKTKAQKVGSLSILDRLKLKRQSLRDAEGFDIDADQSMESSLSKNLKEKLPVTVSNYLNGNLASQPVAQMFVEEERGFRAVLDVPGTASQIQDTVCDDRPARGVQSAVELAVKTEKFFHTFSTFCHGLLAGMALWQCIIVYQLGPPHFETADFFSHYSSLSQPMQTLFYFFFVICIVSAFDRYDIGNPQCSKCALACRSGLIIVIIYPISLLLSLGIANIDDKMSLYNYNASLWITENEMDMDSDLFYWKILNLGRCIGAVLGWIIVALHTNVNSFLHRLEYVDCTVK